MDVDTIEARVSWGDYVTEPPLPEAVLRADDDADNTPRRHVDWVRVPLKGIEKLAFGLQPRR